jgi:hypothetical protein
VWGEGGRGGGSGQLPAVPMSTVLCPLQLVLIKVKDADAGQRQAVLTFTVYTSCIVMTCLGRIGTLQKYKKCSLMVILTNN